MKCGWAPTLATLIVCGPGANAPATVKSYSNIVTVTSAAGSAAASGVAPASPVTVSPTGSCGASGSSAQAIHSPGVRSTIAWAVWPGKAPVPPAILVWYYHSGGPSSPAAAGEAGGPTSEVGVATPGSGEAGVGPDSSATKSSTPIPSGSCMKATVPPSAAALSTVSR